MPEYKAVDPRKSVNKITCEPTVTCSLGDMTSLANNSRNSCQFVARAAVRMSSLHSVCCQLNRAGNELGLTIRAMRDCSPCGPVLTWNPAGSHEIIGVESGAKSPGCNVNGSLTCGERKRRGRVKSGNGQRRS